MKRKIIALLLCIVCVFSLCFPAAADDDGFSAIIGDIDKTCPTCGSALHAFWWSTSGAEVEVEISDTGKIKIPAGAGAIAHIDLKCKSCGYEKKETRLLGLDFGAEKPGKLVQAPSGIGRKDLPGYNDDNGTPSISQDGKLYASMRHSWSRAYQSYNYLVWQCSHSSETLSDYCKGYMEVNQSSCDVPFKVTGDWLNGTSSGFYYRSRFYLIAPISGYYEVPEQVVGSASWESTRDSVQNRDIKVNVSRKFYQKGSAIECFIYVSPTESVESFIFRINKIPYVICEPYDTDYLQVSNTLTINNNTWNGNIYTDNSTNLTYIYPQYTTVNEKNETVTNISNTPIIYNNETKKYYTYDTVTNNYYYITYEQPAAPTPSPSPSPAPSPTPKPAPTDKPGGSISTPETGKPGGSSGSSWWDKLLSKIGDAIIDGLLGAVSAVLKLIFKLLSTILSWIIWAVSRVFDLLPFLPPGLGGLLVGGVVVCFVIGIIKFIRG